MMRGEDLMPWGYDEWLGDRRARRDWMRLVALARLIDQILRTPAVAREGLACILDEVVGDAALIGSQIEGDIEQDVLRLGEWVRAALGAARSEKVAFQSLVVVLPDSAPYRLRLALVDASVRSASDWLGSISWRSSDDFSPTALEALLPSLGELAADVQRQADYAVPLAYAAFLLRDALRMAETSKWDAVREAMVIYDGGDSIDVPTG
jgi:hypothetical protein